MARTTGLKAALLAAALWAGQAAADWEGSGELGLVVARGNSETQTLNAGFEAIYTQGEWTNQSNISFLRTEDRDDVTADRLVLGNRTDFDLSERSFLSGALALRAGFAVRRNSSVEPEREKTDTLTRVNLVYSF